MLDYGLMVDKDSLYNTPNTFGIYVVNLVAKWIEEQGGVDAVEKTNRKKADMVYDVLDGEIDEPPGGARSTPNSRWVRLRRCERREGGCA